MVSLGFEPGAAGWKVRTNPLSYGGTPSFQLLIVTLESYDGQFSSQYEIIVAKFLQEWPMAPDTLYLKMN